MGIKIFNDPIEIGQKVMYDFEIFKVIDKDTSDRNNIEIQIENQDGGTIWVKDWQVEKI